MKNFKSQFIAFIGSNDSDKGKTFEPATMNDIFKTDPSITPAIKAKIFLSIVFIK